VLYLAQDQLAPTFQAALLNALLHALLYTWLLAHETLVLFLFLEPVRDHLVRLLQVVHFGEDLAGEPLRPPAAQPFFSWAPRRSVPFNVAGTWGIVCPSREQSRALHPNAPEVNSVFAHTCTP
tara:strand:+ start:2841 stop:3209 length:369 start_codon:yes stop_codon:yes gene_type:complete